MFLLSQLKFLLWGHPKTKKKNTVLLQFHYYPEGIRTWTSTKWIARGWGNLGSFKCVFAKGEEKIFANGTSTTPVVSNDKWEKKVNFSRLIEPRGHRCQYQPSRQVKIGNVKRSLMNLTVMVQTRRWLVHSSRSVIEGGSFCTWASAGAMINEWGVVESWIAMNGKGNYFGRDERRCNGLWGKFWV